MTEKKPKTKNKRVANKDAIHYVDNKEFFKAICDYIDECNVAEKKGLDKPIVPDYIGDCIWRIASKLANRWEFSKYPFKEDMICDAVENCLTYVTNFDREKSQNPFAYYTQICWFAFFRKIQSEKKYLYTKFSIAKETILHDLPQEDKIALNQKYGNDYSDEVMSEFMEKFEESKRKKKESAKKSSKKTSNKKSKNTLENLLNEQ